MSRGLATIAGKLAVLRGWRWRLLTVLQLLVVLVLGLGLLTLAFSRRAEDFCGDHQVGCGLVSGFISTALIVAAGYFLLFVWTLRRILRQYILLARHTPERLFTGVPRLRTEPAQRPALIQSVLKELSFSRRGAAVLIVGEGGSGKTTFLVSLARRLASGGVVPVPVALMDADLPLDLRAAARTTFVRQIDPVVRTEDDAQRIWRRLSTRGAIVVLADGLDEIAPGGQAHDRDRIVRAALVSARNDRLPMVLTSRPEAVPAGSPVSLLDIGDLDQGEAERFLRRVAPYSTDQKELAHLLDAGEITQVPFYLTIVASLLRAGRQLPERSSGSKDLVLVSLLDEWAKLVLSSDFLPDTEIGVGQRRRIFDGLELVAYVMAASVQLEGTVSSLQHSADELTNAFGLEPVIVGAAAEAGSRLGLVRVSSAGEDAVVKFTHRLSQTYFASRLMRERPKAWEHAVAHADSTEMRDALVMLSVQADQETARLLSEALLDRVASLEDDRALAYLVTATEIAANSTWGDFPAAAHRIFEVAWDKASPRQKLAAIAQLERHDNPWCHRLLLAATRDAAYRVRWSAAQATADAGAGGFHTLAWHFEETIEYAESHSSAVWEADGKAHDIAVAGWVLPALCARLTDADAARGAELIHGLAQLVHHRVPYGHEASVAQGYKLAAVRQPTAEVLDNCLNLAGSCMFWYARLVLVQAASVAAISCGTVPEAVRELRALEAHEQHPFVREAVRLSLRAVYAGDWAPYVWEDESSAIGTSASVLSSETTVLLADVVLLLNLTEQGGRQQSEARKQQVFGRPDLPHCLSTSRSRARSLLTEECPPPCSFGLCPYPTTAEFSLARGRFSQAFCLHQLEIYSRGMRFRWLRQGPSRRRRWNRTGATGMAEFWREMENRAV
jgi:hypothetical protein